MTKFPDKKIEQMLNTSATIRTVLQGTQAGLSCGIFFYFLVSFSPVFIATTVALLVLSNLAERYLDNRSSKAFMAAYGTWYASKIVEDEKQSLAGVIREGLLPYSVKMVPARPYPDEGWDYE